MKVEVPKHFNLKHIDDFLRQISFVFGKRGAKESGFILDISKTKKICLLGQLLLYKFISYTVENQCFINPTIRAFNKSVFEEQIGKSGFKELIYTCVNNPNRRAIEKSCNNLKVVIDNSDLLIAPKKLLRKDVSEREKLENGYLNQVMSFYENTSTARTISFCITELFSNFWSHATQDTGTVMVARGNSDAIEICFADTGEGIVNSFRNSDTKYKSMEKRLIMEKALEKNISSKPDSNHLGLGLYMINSIVAHSEGSVFRIYSDTEEYIYDEHSIGEYKTKSYWEGTITYLKLNITKLVTLDKIDVLKTSSYNKIQWG